jgi:hypothetical protein
MDNKFDVILIGNTLGIYMCSIYLKTSNLKHLVICVEDPKGCDFEGFDKVAGVLDIKDQQDLIHKLKLQAGNLKAEVRDERIVQIGYDGRYDIKHDKFEIQTDKGIYYSKALVCNKEGLRIETSGIFDLSDKILFNEAIELLGNGCKLSFEAREYCSKLKDVEEEERKNTEILKF